MVIPLVGTYKHTWVWDGLDDSNRELPAGVYIVSLTSGHTIDAKKVTILK